MGAGNQPSLLLPELPAGLPWGRASAALVSSLVFAKSRGEGFHGAAQGCPRWPRPLPSGVKVPQGNPSLLWSYPTSGSPSPPTPFLPETTPLPAPLLVLPGNGVIARFAQLRKAGGAPQAPACWQRPTPSITLPCGLCAFGQGSTFVFPPAHQDLLRALGTGPHISAWVPSCLTETGSVSVLGVGGGDCSLPLTSIKLPASSSGPGHSFRDDLVSGDPPTPGPGTDPGTALPA